MITAFQKSAFQNNAFQIDLTPAGGDSWPGDYDGWKKKHPDFADERRQEYLELVASIRNGILGVGEVTQEDAIKVADAIFANVVDFEDDDEEVLLLI